MASAAGAQAAELITTQRRLLLRRAPRQTLNIAGVTFDGRQAAVQRLAPGEPLLFNKEPSNPFDPRAVAIMTLEGQSLGFVGAHLTAGFPLQTCFGRVVSAGPVLATVSDEGDKGGVWGATVSCAPAVHGLCLDPLPSSWQQDLQQVFGGQQWQQLQQQALQQYHQRCAVSAVPAASVPLQVVPSWCWDYQAKQVRLAGLMPLCAPLVLCREQLLQQDAADRAAAVKLFTEVMGWQEELSAGQYVEQYVGFVKQRQQQAELEEWQLVLPADLAAGGASPPAPQTTG